MAICPGCANPHEASACLWPISCPCQHKQSLPGGRRHVERPSGSGLVINVSPPPPVVVTIIDPRKERL